MWFLCLCVQKHKDIGAATLKWKEDCHRQGICLSSELSQPESQESSDSVNELFKTWEVCVSPLFIIYSLTEILKKPFQRSPRGI